MSTPTRGLIFTPDLIPGVMSGAVTVTSRVIKPQPPSNCAYLHAAVNGWAWTDGATVDYDYFPRDREALTCPFRVGERRYLKETWYSSERGDDLLGYVADSDCPHGVSYRVRSSMFMPRWAARTWIEIVSVKPARCQEITEEEAIASGCRPFFDHDNPVQVKSPNGNVHPFAPLKGPLDAYAALWDQLNGKRGYPWIAKCWAWRVTFRTVAP